MLSFISHSPLETEAIGAELSQKLRGGDVLAFRGGLGAGGEDLIDPAQFFEGGGS